MEMQKLFIYNIISCWWSSYWFDSCSIHSWCKGRSVNGSLLFHIFSYWL